MWHSSKIPGVLQAVARDSFLYVDDTCIVFQHKNITEIEKQLIIDFWSWRHWFFDNKLSIHFGQDKTKSILFSSKHKLGNAKSLINVYNGIEIKQHGNAKYLGCILHESLSSKSMALNVIDKASSRLKFLKHLVYTAQLGFQIFQIS